MGYIRHTAIVVTSWNEAFYRSALDKAQALGLPVAGAQIKPMINGYKSFLVAPHGSKAGWAEGDDGDKCVEEFVDWLRAQAYDDGSSSLEWAVISYGSDDKTATIEDHAWRRRRKASASPRPG